MHINELQPGTRFRTSFQGMPGPHVLERIPDEVYDGRTYNAMYTKSRLRTRIEPEEQVVPCEPETLFTDHN